MRIIEREKYVEVYADEGMALTTYKDGDDISTYDGFSVVYVKKESVQNIREITLEQHRAYMKEKEDRTNQSIEE